MAKEIKTVVIFYWTDDIAAVKAKAADMRTRIKWVKTIDARQFVGEGELCDEIEFVGEVPEDRRSLILVAHGFEAPPVAKKRGRPGKIDVSDLL